MSLENLARIGQPEAIEPCAAQTVGLLAAIEIRLAESR